MHVHEETLEKSDFFQIGSEKLIELSLASFGLYGLFWTYANWRQIQHQGEDINPWLRTLFSPIYQLGLYRRIHTCSGEADETPRWKPHRIY